LVKSDSVAVAAVTRRMLAPEAASLRRLASAAARVLVRMA